MYEGCNKQNLKFAIYSIRIGSCVFLSVLSLLLVGTAVSSSMALLGVVFASAASGIGETTFLAYSAYYHQ